MFLKVPQSSLGIPRVPQLPPPLGTPPLKNPIKQQFLVGFQCGLETSWVMFNMLLCLPTWAILIYIPPYRSSNNGPLCIRSLPPFLFIIDRTRCPFRSSKKRVFSFDFCSLLPIDLCDCRMVYNVFTEHSLEEDPCHGPMSHLKTPFFGPLKKTPGALVNLERQVNEQQVAVEANVGY